MLTATVVRTLWNEEVTLTTETTATIVAPNIESAREAFKKHFSLNIEHSDILTAPADVPGLYRLSYGEYSAEVTIQQGATLEIVP